MSPRRLYPMGINPIPKPKAHSLSFSKMGRGQVVLRRSSISRFNVYELTAS
jgi:hypothetical protein